MARAASWGTALLIELRVHNLAVVAEARLRLAEGLNVLSGSTGAGKSLLVEAMRWLCGERIDHGLLRAGATKAYAEAIFDLGDRPDLIRRLRELGVELSEDHLLRVRRELRAGGRSRALLGAELSTAAVLAAVMRLLVGLQSQHRQLALLDPAQHVELLDGVGVDAELLEAYAESLSDYEELRERIHLWRARRQQLREQYDLLQYQRQELEEHGLRQGEMAELLERVGRLSGGAKLLRSLAAAREALGEEEQGAIERVARARAQLEQAAADWEPMRDCIDQLAAAEALLQESERALSDQLDEDPVDPAELDRLQERLHALQQLTRKYTRDESELIALRDRLADELDELALDEELPKSLRGEWEAACLELQRHATALHRARKSCARRVAKESGALLEELGMPGAGLEFELRARADADSGLRVEGEQLRAGRSGTHEVRLLARTNRGAGLLPVERAASGGELSRIGLVLRELSLREARPLLLILDEIDSGLGADLGPAVARRLATLAQASQLLVISHLPAVAAAADRHFVVRKESGSDLAVAALERLEGTERESELARMLGGEGKRELGLARELLQRARASGP